MTIRSRTALRVMPAVWFGPAIIFMAVWYATSVSAVDRYALAASASGSAALPFIAAYVCAAAAWEGARLRRGGIWAAPWSRSRVAIAAGPIALTVLFGVLAVVVAISLQLARSGASVPDARIVAVSSFDLLTWAVIGFALGVRLPFAAATPIALVLPFLWLGFIPAIDPLWLRHITGMFRDCCGADEDLAPVAVIASVLVDAAFLVAAWTIAIAGSGRLRSHLLVGGVTVVVAAIAAASLVSGLGFAPVVTRDASSLVCRQLAAAELCLWPEHTDRYEELAAITSDVLQGWRSVGLPAPSLVTEANRRVAPPAALAASFSDVHGRDAAILALARGAIPANPDCLSAVSGVVSATTGGVAEPYLEAWYASAGGLSPAAFSATYDQVSDMGGQAVSGIVSELASALPERRARWVSKVTALLTTCDPVEPDVTVDP